jgi:hypothetical protein
MAAITDKEIQAMQKSLGALSSNVKDLISLVKTQQQPETAKIKTKTLGDLEKEKKQEVFTAKEGAKLLNKIEKQKKTDKQEKEESKKLTKSLKVETDVTKKKLAELEKTANETNKIVEKTDKKIEKVKTIADEGNKELIKQIKSLAKQIVEDKKAFSELNTKSELKLQKYAADTMKVMSKLSFDTNLIKKSSTSTAQSKKIDQSVVLAKKNITLLKSVITISKDIQATVTGIKKQAQLLVSKLITNKKTIKQVKGVDKEKLEKKLSFGDSFDHILETVKQSLSLILLGGKSKRVTDATIYHLKNVNEKLDKIEKNGVKIIKKAPEINKEKLLQEKLNEINRNTRSTIKNVKETKKLVVKVGNIIPKIDKNEHDLLDTMKEAEEQRLIEAQRKKALDEIMAGKQKEPPPPPKKQITIPTAKEAGSWLGNLLKNLAFAYMIFKFLIANKDKILPLIKNVFKQIFEWIPWKDVFIFAGKSLVALGEIVVSVLSGIFSGIWTSIKYSKFGKVVREAIGKVTGFIKDVFSDVGNWIKGTWIGKTWKVVSDFFVEKFSGPIAAIKEFVKPVTDFTKNLFTSIWDGLTVFFKTAAYGALGLLVASLAFPVVGGIIRKYILGPPFRLMLNYILYPIVSSVFGGIWNKIKSVYQKKTPEIDTSGWDKYKASRKETLARNSKSADKMFSAANKKPSKIGGFFRGVGKVGAAVGGATLGMLGVGSGGEDEGPNIPSVEPKSPTTPSAPEISTKPSLPPVKPPTPATPPAASNVGKTKGVFGKGFDWIKNGLMKILKGLGKGLGKVTGIVTKYGPSILGKIGGAKGKLAGVLLEMLLSAGMKGGMAAFNGDFTGTKRQLMLSAIPILFGFGGGTILGSIAALGTGWFSGPLGAMLAGAAGDYLGSMAGEYLAPKIADYYGFTEAQEQQELEQKKNPPAAIKDIPKSNIPNTSSPTAVKTSSVIPNTTTNNVSPISSQSFNPETKVVNSEVTYKPIEKPSPVREEMIDIKKQMENMQEENRQRLTDLGNGVIATQQTVVQANNGTIKKLSNMESSRQIKIGDPRAGVV